MIRDGAESQRGTRTYGPERKRKTILMRKLLVQDFLVPACIQSCR